ncbi:MAG: CoA ester lyase [Deltaproteobacteria bacterium]|nr:MAG: CoA ester lyase [Deltaproteobacteria bacterium]
MRPNRTNLSVPGHVKKMHSNALICKADVVMLDLEDSVPTNKKHEALKMVIQSLRDLNWGTKTVTVRINAPDTPFAYKEIIEIIENAGERLDAIVVPKINHPGDIHFISRLLDGVEMGCHFKKKIKIEASIETAKGLEAVSEIAKASSRMKTLVFGVADYSDSIGARLVSLSGHGENEEEIYPGHRWHYPLSKIVAAAKANDLLAIDAPFGNFKDMQGLKRSAALASALGYDGKWVIHPDQIESVNKIFTPSPKEIERAKSIQDAVKKAGNIGRGAVAIDGKMMDQATLRLAKKILDQAAHLGLV